MPYGFKAAKMQLLYGSEYQCIVEEIFHSIADDKERERERKTTAIFPRPR